MNAKVKTLLIKNISIFLLYILLYLLLPNFYFEMPRVRIAMVLSLIVLFDFSYIYGISAAILGVNIFSSIGIFDFIVSSIVTILSIFIASKYVFKKSVFKASLVIVLASISSAIAMKVHYNIEFNFISKLLHCLGGDFMVISLFGSLLFYVIRDTKIFKIITKGKE